MAKEEKTPEKEVAEKGSNTESSGLDLSNETDESLNTTLRVMMRIYPHQTTPVMQAYYDELQKRGVKAPEKETEKDAA